MTVSTTDNRVQFDGDGSSIEFPFTFGIFDDDDIDVILTSSAGVETTLTRGVDYDVTLTDPTDLPSAGLVTFIGTPTPTPPTSTETVTIIRILDYTQEIDITDGGPLAASSLNEAHDRAVMLIQQIKEMLGRSLVLPTTSTVSGLTIDDPDAGKALIWNDDEDGLTNLDLSTIGAIAISTLGQSLIDDETATAMLTTLGLDTDLLTLSLPASTTISAFIKTLLDDADASSALTTLGVSTFAKTLLDDTDAATARATLGVSAGKDSQLLDNLGLTASVGSNALTIALKGTDGNDPSASNVVTVAFRSSTLTTGTPVFRTVIGALSITIPDTKSPGFSASENGRMYVWLIDNAGTLELAISRTADIFPEGNLVSTTAVSGASSATVMYSTTARSNLACRCIGYIEIQLGASSHWSNAATKIQVMGVGVKRTGDIVQITTNNTSAYATGNTSIPMDDTIPQITEGFEVLTNTITPTSALNKLIIDSDVNMCGSTANAVTIALFQDSTANALAAGIGVTEAGAHGQMRITHSMLAGTTSSTTFRTRIGNASTNAIYINGASAARLYGGVASTTMKVTEVFA